MEESVEFSESICSQSTFKFGLSESSTIEFETVGVGNMLGMTIDCGIEIDLSSLTAAQLADIAAGTWDGEYVALADSDIGYAFFRVPYGRFIVRKCPRDHQAMTHRRVEAYTDTKLLSTPYVDKMLGVKGTSNVYTVNFALLFYSVIGWDNEQILLDAGFTKTVVSSFDVQRLQGNYFNVNFSGYDRVEIYPHYVSIPLDDATNLRGIDGLEKIDTSVIFSSVAAELVQNYGVPEAEAYDYSKYDYPSPGFGDPTFSNPKLIEFNGASYRYFLDCGSNSELMVVNSDREDVYTSVNVFRDMEVHLYRNGAEVGYFLSSIATGLDEAFVYQYAPPADMGWGDFEMQLKPSGTDDSRRVASVPIYSFSESLDVSKAISDFLEANASFAAPSRKKGYRSFSLSDTAVESLNAGEYSEFWWDEYDTIPIGKVKYSMEGSDGKESTLTYDFSDDQSVYEMNGNDILKESRKTQAEIEAVFDDAFIPKLDAVAFTPIEITIGNGLPYLEAGDCIEATSYDNVTAKSYLLEQRITGIQHLTQTAESHGGDLMNAKED